MPKQRMKRQRQQHGYKVATGGGNRYRKQAGKPERELQRTIESYLTAAGWHWTHTPDSRRTRGKRGFPDIFAVRKGHMLAIECKAKGGRVSTYQQEWLGELAIAGAQTAVVTPDNLQEFMFALGTMTKK